MAKTPPENIVPEVTPVDDVRRIRARLLREAGGDVFRLMQRAESVARRLQKRLGLVYAPLPDREIREAVHSLVSSPGQIKAAGNGGRAGKNRAPETPVTDVRRIRERLDREAGGDARRHAEQTRRVAKRLRKRLGLVSVEECQKQRRRGKTRNVA